MCKADVINHVSEQVEPNILIQLDQADAENLESKADLKDNLALPIDSSNSMISISGKNVMTEYFHYHDMILWAPRQNLKNAILVKNIVTYTEPFKLHTCMFVETYICLPHN